MCVGFFDRMEDMGFFDFLKRRPEQKEVKERERLQFTSSEVTEASLAHPDRNEDASFVSAEDGFMVVSDGAGGHAGGDEVSRRIVQSFAETLEHVRGVELGEDSLEKASELLEMQVLKAAQDAYTFSMEVAQTLDDPRKRPMATVMAGRVIRTEQGIRAIIKSVGDGLAYVRRANGEVEQVPIVEDSYVAMYFEKKVRKGELSEEDVYRIMNCSSPLDFDFEPDLVKGALLKKEAQFYFKKRNVVTASLGSDLPDSLDVHSAIVALDTGDELFFMSDGVENLTDDERKMLLSGGPHLQSRAEALMSSSVARSQSRSRRSKKDDVTVTGLEVRDVVHEEMEKAAAVNAKIERLRDRQEVFAGRVRELGKLVRRKGARPLERMDLYQTQMQLADVQYAIGKAQLELYDEGTDDKRDQFEIQRHKETMRLAKANRTRAENALGRLQGARDDVDRVKADKARAAARNASKGA